MRAEDFFAVILPRAGLRCVYSIVDGRPRQGFGADDKWLSDTTQKLDAKGLDAYFACASFKDASSRKQVNARAVRSFWLDVDCGDGKDYSTQGAALADLKRFLADTSLPTPMVVSSGRGVHLYWPMDEDMTPEEWTPLAEGLKRACAIVDFRADKSRTADLASVLRPPGTHNHKRGTPVEVRVLRQAGPFKLDDWRTLLVSFLSRAGVQVDTNEIEGTPPAGMDASANADLVGDEEHPSSSAPLIAEKCAVIRHVRDTKGNVSQPLWFRALGVLAFTEEGEKVCQEWSSGHPAYSEGETATKVAQVLKYKPTTCAKLGEELPEACAACPFNGKIKSPIVLGRPEPTPQDPAVSLATAQIDLPHGFRWAPFKGHWCLQRQARDEDGNESWTPFCDTLFYPVTRINRGDGDGFALEIEMLLPKGRKRRFTIPTSMVGAGRAALAGELAKHELVPHYRCGPIMEAYLAKWMDRLKHTADETLSHKSFGWAGRDFVLGDELFTADGSKPVVLSGIAHKKAEALQPRGSLDVWKDLVDRAYNRPGLEAFQYMVMCGFASPLFAMMGNYGGITVYAHSAESGVGKTTAQRVALSAWGNWDSLQLADGKATKGALWALVGAYHNLPVVFDELTNQSNRDASEVVFSISSGRARERLAADGTPRDNNSNWSTVVLSSGNNMLSEKLALHRANAEAEMSRLFEFTVDAHTHLTPNEAAEIFPLFLKHYGHAGREFTQYVVQNYDLVQARLAAVQQKFNERAGIRQAERYWSALQASVLTALSICRRLDLVQFDPAALAQWIIGQTSVNRTQIAEAVQDPLEQFGKMLNDMWTGVLVTIGEGDVRSGARARVEQDPKGALVGRVILASNKTERSQFYISGSFVKEWCNKHGVSAGDMHRALVKAGWSDGKRHRVSLGKGTVSYGAMSAQVACWLVDPDRLAATATAPLAMKMQLVGTETAEDRGW